MKILRIGLVELTKQVAGMAPLDIVRTNSLFDDKKHLYGGIDAQEDRS